MNDDPKNAVKSETVSPANAEEELRNAAIHLVASINAEQCRLNQIEVAEIQLESYASYVSSLSSQAIGAAAKEAAEKIVCDWSDISTHRLDHQPRQVEAIILAAIEKARTK